jgi:hypothetical protein
VPSTYVGIGDTRLTAEVVQRQLDGALKALWGNKGCEGSLKGATVVEAGPNCVQIDESLLCWSSDGEVVNRVWADIPTTAIANDVRVLLAHALIADPSLAQQLEEAKSWAPDESGCDDPSNPEAAYLDIQNGAGARSLILVACSDL